MMLTDWTQSTNYHPRSAGAGRLSSASRRHHAPSRPLGAF